jgi:hypothetical protein
VAVIDQKLTDRFAVYNGDSCEVLPTLPAESVHLSIYSPPFAGLYRYSSDRRDLSNGRTYEEFLAHYEFIVREISRVTLPGRISAVHCMDVPKRGANIGGYSISQATSFACTKSTASNTSRASASGKSRCRPPPHDGEGARASADRRGLDSDQHRVR